MLFNSPVYILLFLPIAVLLYFWLNNRRLTIMAKLWLVLASLFFYAYWNPVYLLLIIGSILVNFAIGKALQKNTDDEKALLTCGILLNLALLAYFKYADFFISNVNWMLGESYSALNLVLPLAISFFTFQQIAFLVDSYKSEVREYSFLNYAAFVSFFPQLIAGPIVHHSEMMPQFMRAKNRVIHWGHIYQGLFIFSMGLFKKVVIADSFAEWANRGFDAGYTLGFVDSWITSLSYSMQLYYDFSGYSDMAIGAALMFNIRLPVNFNSPYKALSIREFWRRWHITLSRWLRDYVYIPLGGSRGGTFSSYHNVMVTFLLGGLWHGAGWSFVIWGGLHGLALVIHRLWRGMSIVLPRALSWFVTFMFVNSAWVFFRADNINDALRILGSMTGLNGIAIPRNLAVVLNKLMEFQATIVFEIDNDQDILFENLSYVYLFVFFAIAVFVPNTLQMGHFIACKGRFRMGSGWRTNIVIIFLFSISIYMVMNMSNRVSEFLYFNF